MRNMTTVREKAVNLCVEMAPNAKVRDAFRFMYGDLVKEFPTIDEDALFVDRMLGSLLDGLRYGNWPIQLSSTNSQE